MQNRILQLLSDQVKRHHFILSPSPKLDPLNNTELAEGIILDNCVWMKPNGLTRCWREV